MSPAEKAARHAEKYVKTGHKVGGGPCPKCGHTLACHWPNGCIRQGCGCKGKSS